jgi:hypothetical protein
MGNLNPACLWPNCECQTEKDDPCKFDDPDFYMKKQSFLPEKEYQEREIVYKFLGEVYQELARARKKFPDSRCCTVALMEEVGELAQAMLKVAAGKWPESRIREEAVQVAVMAIRVCLEGDSSISLYCEEGRKNA